MRETFTTEVIENLLAREEYKPVPRLDKRDMTSEQKKEANEVEKVGTFGYDTISLFDDMVEELGTLPTQEAYVERGIKIAEEWYKENRENTELTYIKKETIKLRMTRTYMSKVIELHLSCIFDEYLPELTVYELPSIDSIMGVDMVVEDDSKRYYVHVTSNTPFAMKMLKQKENRGGIKRGGSYIPYNRNFTGDLILKYDIHTETDTTQIINQFPLFKPDYIVERLFIAKRQSKIGESLKKGDSKIGKFTEWVKMYAPEDVFI